jgi:hypothetical protein
VSVPPLEVLEPEPSDRHRIVRLSQQLFHFGFDEVVNASFADPEREVGLETGMRRSPSATRFPSTRRFFGPRFSAGCWKTPLQSKPRHRGVSIFEIGKIFCRAEGGECGEDLTLGLLSSGPLDAPRWYRPAPRPASII